MKKATTTEKLAKRTKTFPTKNSGGCTDEEGNKWALRITKKKLKRKEKTTKKKSKTNFVRAKRDIRRELGITKGDQYCG